MPLSSTLLALLVATAARAEEPDVAEPVGAFAPLAGEVHQTVRVTRMARGFVNPWLVVAGDSAVLVDTHYPRRLDWLVRQLRDARVRFPTDPPGGSEPMLRAVVLTHGHSDHAGAAAAFRDLAGIPVIAGAPEVPMLRAGRNPPLDGLGALSRLVSWTVPPTYPSFSPDLLVERRFDLHPWGLPGEARLVGIHSPGSIVVVLDSGDAFIGDLLRSRLLAHHAPTEHFFQSDIPAAHRAVEALIDEGAVRLYPGHGGMLDAERVDLWLARHPPR